MNVKGAGLPEPSAEEKPPGSKRWIYQEEEIRHDRDFSRIVESILVRRGFLTAEARLGFLTPRLANLADPLRLPDMQKAVARVERAISRRESILIYSDYDVDGMSSSAFLFRFLRELGACVRAFVPERLSEGYGLSSEGVRRALEKGPEPSLLLALDCGTTSVEEIDLLNQRGIDVVVIDHHELPPELPAAHALVNPQRGLEEDRIFATVGLVFKFCHAFLKLRGDPKLFDLKTCLDLVALGTVADLVPLEGDNRILVYHGLLRLNQTSHVGLQELMRMAGVKRAATPSTLGFVLGPRLNASGRMSDASLGFEILTTDDRGRSVELARLLENLNRQRQKLEQDAVEEAEAGLAGHFQEESDRCIVAGSRKWHQGVVGIVASRLLRNHYRPCVVISIDANGKGKGSARGIDGFSLMDALRSCGEHLVKYGGHAMAAGLEIEEENIPAFRRQLNAWLEQNVEEGVYLEKLSIDLRLGVEALTEELAEALGRMEPFGQKNRPPLIAVEGVAMRGSPRLFGKQHLKCVLGNGSLEFEAVGFGMADRPFPGGLMSVAGYWEIDSFSSRPVFRMLDWK